ncbi:MAG: hypothetical protein QUS33_08265 [Dehalococcoidia bacterium]|nr:hypothetical protein [Dehalococcoidia bacterium]
MYLDRPLVLILSSGSWPDISAGNAVIAYEHDDHIYYFNDESTTPWQETNAGIRRHRYIYRYEATTGIMSASLAGTWGSASRQWIGPTIGEPIANYRKLENYQRVYTTLNALLDEFAIPAQYRTAQKVSLTCSFTVRYHIWKQDQQKWLGVWVDIGGLQDMGTVDFTLTQEYTIEITDFPAADLRFVQEECSVSLPHLHLATEPVTFTVTWVNSYVPDHDTRQWVVVAWCQGIAKAQWVGIVKQDQNGKQTVTFTSNAQTLLGRTPQVGETIQVIFEAYRDTISLANATGRVTISIPFLGLPPADPKILSELCSCTVNEYHPVAPTDRVGFTIVLEKSETGHDSYPTQSVWLAAIWQPTGKMTLLWTGSFPAGTPAATRITQSFTLTPEQLAGQSITTEQYANVLFYTGNGAQYQSGLPYGFAARLAVVPPPTPQYGTIEVDANIAAAPFTLSGPASYSGKTPWKNTQAPAGTYHLSWGEVQGYVKPAGSTKQLSADGRISFQGIYEESGEPPEPPEPPTEAKIPIAIIGTCAGAAVVLWAAGRRR